MKAFIATSIRHAKEAKRVIAELDAMGISYQCCVTENRNDEGKALFDHNFEGIAGADIFISILKDLGKDVSAEIGIAYALNKPRIAVDVNADPKEVMPYFAAGRIVKPGELREAIESISPQKEPPDITFAELDLRKYGPTAMEAFAGIFRSQGFVDGAHTKALEETLSKRYGREIVAVPSGTTGLIIALESVLSGKREVIVPSLTFPATIQAVIHAGGTPVFTDVSKDDWNIDPEDIEREITPKTGAILAVNLFGVPSRISELEKMSRDSGIPLIFDSCQAFGARHASGEVGIFGTAEVFSLDATKIVSGGLGGFITASDPSLIRRLRMAKNFGNDEDRYPSRVGLNGRMSEFNAVLARLSLNDAEGNLSRLDGLAQRYKKTLSGVDGVRFQDIGNSRPSYQYLPVLIDRTEETVRRIMSDLEREGIGTRLYNPTNLHQLKFFSTTAASLPNTEAMNGKILCLPTHKRVTMEHMDITRETISRNL